MGIAGVIALPPRLVPVETVHAAHGHGSAMVADVVAFAFDETRQELHHNRVVEARTVDAGLHIRVASRSSGGCPRSGAGRCR